MDDGDSVGVEPATHASPTPHFSPFPRCPTSTACMSLPVMASFREFASVRARASWLAHLWPDSCFGLIQAGQVTDVNFDPSDVKVLNVISTKVKSRWDLALV